MKTYLVLFMIFCIIGSAAAVCAADAGDDFDAQALTQSNDFDGGWAGSQYNETLENATNVTAATNATTTNVTAATNATTTNATNATNITANTTAPVANTTNATVPHNMLATGNPVLLLLGVSAVLGGYTVLRKKD